MVKDYAKLRAANAAPRQRRFVMVMLIAASIGLLAVAVFYGVRHQVAHRHSTQAHTKQHSAKKPTSKKAMPVHHTQHSNVQFDFYTLLPNMKIPQNHPDQAEK